MSSPRPSPSSAVPRRTVTPRKKPHCTHCGSPMLGHKRGQCITPNVPLDAKGRDDSVDLARVLKDLHLQTGNGEDKEPTARKRKSAPGQTVTEVKDELVDDDGARKAEVRHWLEDVPQSLSRLPHSKEIKLTVEDSNDDTYHHQSDITASKRQSVASTAKPLGKTLSMEGRDAFLKDLVERSKKPVANVFTVALCDIHDLEKDAKRLKFHARVIAPEYADGTNGDGWLVIGRDVQSVDQLFEEVARDVKRDQGTMSTTVGRLGSGAVGAAVAWLYLAYS